MLKLPPPIWTLIYILLGAVMSWSLGWPKIPGLPLPPLGIILVALAFIPPVWAFVLFRREDTEIDPTSPTNRKLALQLQFSPEMSFARIGLMGSAPRRPCEDIGVRDAPLGKLRGDTADFLDRPADQERRFGRDRSFVFLSDRPVLAR